jgi:hypothetical protein
VAGDLDAEFAKLLDKSPDLGTCGSDFFCKLSAAQDDGRMIAEYTNDVAESHICLLQGMRFNGGPRFVEIADDRIVYCLLSIVY